MTAEKPIHVKPALYAFYYESLKEIALKYGFNLLLHGSMQRDLDLVAVPWNDSIGSREEMIEEFARVLGGYILNDVARSRPHGRTTWVININRGPGGHKDPQYYLDISVF